MIVIGYGFCDEHINGILKQALRGNPNKRLVAVTYFGSLSGEETAQRTEKFKIFIEQQLGLDADTREKLVLIVSNAKNFIAEALTLKEMASHFPQEDSLFDEIATDDALKPELLNGKQRR